MSLRWKIAGVLAAVAAIATVAVGVVGYRSTEQRLVDEIDRAVEQTAGLLAPRRGPDRVPQRGIADQYVVRVVGPRGVVDGSNDDVGLPIDTDLVERVAGDPGRRVTRTVTADDGERYRLMTIGAPVGALEIGRSLDETDSVLRDLRRRTVLLVVLVALGAAALGLVVADRIARPIRRLASSAEEVSETNRLDVELPSVTSRDEVGRLGTAFSSMLGALARSRAEQERLVQDAGHELRTPLTSLRTNLGVLRRHDDLDPAMRAEIIADLESEVNELTELVNEVVAVASGGASDEPPEAVDVAEVVRSAAERVGRRRQRTIDVRVGTPDTDGGSASAAAPATSPCTVWIAPAALDRAVVNLVDNACKFDASGEPIEVVVTSNAGFSNAGTVSVRVLDRGPGIDPGEEELVFDRFHRSEATRSMPGSGLGLSIVRDVVAAAGGTVVAGTRPDGGAIIGFDLPAVLADGPS